MSETTEIPVIRASHILVDTQKQANNILEKLAEGADFASLAKAHSLCPSKANGGDLGTFSPGRMVKPFEEAVFKLAVGEISQPIASAYGWHIVIRHE